MSQRAGRARLRTGLVLGAGGVMGGAWITGSLQAIATETGWDPASADHVVGTSAGAVMGALCAAGVPPWFMVAHSAGEVFEGVMDAAGRPVAEADRSAGAVFHLDRVLPRPWPGSPRLALNSLLRPGRVPLAAALMGWVPAGLISNEPLKQTIRRAVPSGWADHPALWIVAVDYASGERVAFGRAGAPTADLADAVAASAAIPGFYRPVTIAGRRYVDGGAWSFSNLDLLAGRGLDLVICLNPSSSAATRSDEGPLDRMEGLVRRRARSRLRREAALLEGRGTEVVIIEPLGEDLAVMGRNPMRTRRRHEVIETALATVAGQLRRPDVRARLDRLPPGDPDRIRRPRVIPTTLTRVAAPSRAAAR